MPKARHLLKNINLINIILAGILIALFLYMNSSFFDISVNEAIPVAKKSTAEKLKEEEKPSRTQSPSAMDYLIIAEQNLFHPERKIPVVEKETPPVKKPDFVLYGTLITDDLTVAYIDDKKSPRSTPGRGKRQTALKLGDSMSGYTLRKIETDKIVMERGEEKIIVYLNDPLKPKTRSISSEPAPQKPKTKKAKKIKASKKQTSR